MQWVWKSNRKLAPKIHDVKTAGKMYFQNIEPLKVLLLRWWYTQNKSPTRVATFGSTDRQCENCWQHISKSLTSSIRYCLCFVLMGTNPTKIANTINSVLIISVTGKKKKRKQLKLQLWFWSYIMCRRLTAFPNLFQISDYFMHYFVMKISTKVRLKLLLKVLQWQLANIYFQPVILVYLCLWS